MSRRRYRHAFATVSGPVLAWESGQHGARGIHRGEVIQIGDGLESNTKRFGIDHTTLQWFYRRGDRAC